MKLSISVLRVVLASAMAFNGVMAHAQVETQATAAKDIQAAQIKEIDARFSTLKQRQEDLMKFVDMLGHATESKDGYEIDLKLADDAVAYVSPTLRYGVVPARVFMHFRPDNTFSKLGTKPANYVLAVGALTIVGSYALSRYATAKLNITKGEMVRANANIANLQRLMTADEEFIKTQSATLGARVTNNMVSFEGFHLPDGLKWINSANPSLILGNAPQ